MASNEEILSAIRSRTPACAKVGVFDVDGIFRGKYMAADKLGSSGARRRSARAACCVAFWRVRRT
jgi:hypothetical protein